MRDNTADRKLGETWEKNFGRAAEWYNKAFFPYQRDRTGAARWQSGKRFALTPDVVIFTAGGEHHEVKHKNPSRPRKGEPCYGLEVYRLKALVELQRETKQPVFYTIHDWGAAGAKTSTAPMANLVQDWRLVAVDKLWTYALERLRAEGVKTWLNGTFKECPAYYWPTGLWTRLDLYWGLPE
jgi:hypothetical protein